MITILLTGGLGYIGSNIAIKLLNNNYNIIIIDNLSNSNIERLNIIEKLSNKTIPFYNYDMNDIYLVDSVFKKHDIDVVIHLAGLKAVNESIKNPLIYYSNNINITINLLQTMKKYKCYNIIFSSSATVYGNQPIPFVEEMLTGINLTNPYGKTKYIIEEMLKDIYQSNKNFNIIILRYFNPLGSDESGLLYDDPNGIPNNLFPYILKVHNKILPILNVFGNDYNTKDGTCIRDFIHVIDLAIGHVKAVDYILKNKSFEIFNLGTGNPTTVLDVITTFEQINNTKLNYKIVGRREGDVMAFYADNTKANKLLDWQCKYTLQDMVKLDNDI